MKVARSNRKSGLSMDKRPAIDEPWSGLTCAYV